MEKKNNRGRTNPRYDADKVQYIRENLDVALEDPEKVARWMKDKGMYSSKTFVGDIRRTVFKLAEMIRNGDQIAVKE